MGQSTAIDKNGLKPLLFYSLGEGKVPSFLAGNDTACHRHGNKRADPRDGADTGLGRRPAVDVLEELRDGIS